MKNFAIRSIFNLVSKDINTKKPLLYFESMKASSIGLKHPIVYARGGRGNPKLVGFPGEKDIKIDGEEALLSPKSLGLFMGRFPEKFKKVVHIKEDIQVQPNKTDPIKISPVKLKFKPVIDTKHPMFVFTGEQDGASIKEEMTKTSTAGSPDVNEYDITIPTDGSSSSTELSFGSNVKPYDVIIIDYYYETLSETNEIRVTTDDFPDNMYWEGDALVRTQGDNLDHAVRITIPNGQLITDGFTIALKPSGEPSTFKFSIDCLKPLRGKDLIILDIDEDTI